MAVRANMQPLIDLLRIRGAADNTEVFQSVTYWIDQQLQDILDEHSKYMTVRILPVTTTNLIFLMKGMSKGIFIDPDTITIVDDSGDAYTTTSATFSIATREFTTLAALDEDRKWYIQARYLSLYHALEDLWRRKAAQRRDAVDMRAGQNQLNASQEYRHCIGQADYWRNKTARRFNTI